MAYTNENNNPRNNAGNTSGGTNSLYFIVGGLVVAAVIFGLFFYNSTETSMNSTTPAAGLENTVENANPDMNPVTPGNQDVVPEQAPNPAQ